MDVVESGRSMRVGPVTVAELDGIVRELRDVRRHSGIESALAVGALILQHFFENSEAVWRMRRRNKQHSIRRLAERPDCPLSKSALNNAVAVYVLCRELPSVQTFGHIGVSHLIAVLGLPSEEQLSWIERAEAERWSVRELIQRMRSARGNQRESRARSSEGTEALLNRLDRELDGLTAAVVGCASDDLSASHYRVLRRLARRLQEVRAMLLKMLRDSGAAASGKSTPALL